MLLKQMHKHQKTTSYWLVFLVALCMAQLSFGQTIKENGVDVPLDPDTKMKLEMLIDSLVGDWELIKTITISDGDTLIQEPSSAPPGITTAKPPTTLHFDTAQAFSIYQFCMKCPLLKWSGHYTVEIRGYMGLGFFYLNFIDQRDKHLRKKQKSFTADFNGYLTNFEDGILQLTDDKACDWIYKRKTKQ